MERKRERRRANIARERYTRKSAQERKRGRDRNEKERKGRQTCRRCSVDTGDRDSDSFRARRPCCVFVAFGERAHFAFALKNSGARAHEISQNCEPNVS